MEKKDCFVRLFVNLNEDIFEWIEEQKQLHAILNNGLKAGFKYYNEENDALTIDYISDLITYDISRYHEDIKIKIKDGSNEFLFGPIYINDYRNDDTIIFNLIPIKPYKLKKIEGLDEIDTAYYIRCMLRLFKNFVIDKIEAIGF